MAFNLTPQSLGLLMGGLNMMAASRGGNPDLTKGGLGYALQQGMQGGLQGVQLGKQFQQDEQKQKMIDDMLMKLNLDPTAQQSTGVPKPGVQQSALAKLTPEQKEMAKMAIMSGDWKSVAELMKTDTAIGGFKDMDTYLKALQSTRKGASTALAPSNESLRKYAQVTDMVSTKKGFDNLSGADDTVLMKGFASMILPGEAVMSDDINIIAQQDGIPGWFKAYAAQIKGSGQLAPNQRAQIYQTMTTLAERASMENQQLRSQFDIDQKLGNFPEGSIFTKPIGFNPYTPPKPSITPQGVNPNLQAEINKLEAEIKKLEEGQQ